MAAGAGRRLCSWLLVLSACAGRGTVNSPARRHQRQQVDGMLGGSAWLVLHVPPGDMGDKSHLDFLPRPGDRGELAVLKGGRWEHSRAPNRFGQRLEMVNRNPLRITCLEKGDGGLFEASVRLPSAEIQRHLFNLTVYAPVSEPQILLRSISNTPGKCSVTLWCRVSGDGEHNLSWAIGAEGRPRRTLEGSSDWYQLSDDGSSLQLLWHPSLSDSSIHCLAWNPVDQKNASFDLLKTCPNESGDASSCQLNPFVAAYLSPPILMVMSVSTLALKNEGSLTGRDSDTRGGWIILFFVAIGCILYADQQLLPSDNLDQES